jgi:hypothetical protein
MRHILQKKSLWVVVLMGLIVGIVGIRPARSAENRLIPFQGRLTDGDGEALDGVYRITFVIYEKPTGGVGLWSEVHESVSIIRGQINVLLGSMTSLDDPDGNGDIADAVQFTMPKFLGIKVGEDSNQEMVPRQQIVPSFHAVRASTSDALSVTHADGSKSSYGIDRIVPIGVITPFYGDPATLPDNWKVCDGSMVNDMESPFNGMLLPDLRERFIRGEAESSRNVLGDLEEGGSDSHAHDISLGDAGIHKHYASVTVSGTTGSTGAGCPVCWCGDIFANCWASGGHSHTFSATKSFSTSDAGNHTHTATLGEKSHLPSYVAIHYIIRIK